MGPACHASKNETLTHRADGALPKLILSPHDPSRVAMSRQRHSLPAWHAQCLYPNRPASDTAGRCAVLARVPTMPKRRALSCNRNVSGTSKSTRSAGSRRGAVHSDISNVSQQRALSCNRNLSHTSTCTSSAGSRWGAVHSGVSNVSQQRAVSSNRHLSHYSGGVGAAAVGHRPGSALHGSGHVLRQPEHTLSIRRSVQRRDDDVQCYDTLRRHQRALHLQVPDIKKAGLPRPGVKHHAER